MLADTVRARLSLKNFIGRILTYGKLIANHSGGTAPEIIRISNYSSSQNNTYVNYAKKIIPNVSVENR